MLNILRSEVRKVLNEVIDGVVYTDAVRAVAQLERAVVETLAGMPWPYNTAAGLVPMVSDVAFTLWDTYVVEYNAVVSHILAEVDAFLMNASTYGKVSADEGIEAAYEIAARDAVSVLSGLDSDAQDIALAVARVITAAWLRHTMAM